MEREGPQQIHYVIQREAQTGRIGLRRLNALSSNGVHSIEPDSKCNARKKCIAFGKYNMHMQLTLMQRRVFVYMRWRNGRVQLG